ncbi:dsDNA nuclease domain-containing protein [Aliivibrio fischeri]|uniref:CD-NTase associated protein 4-like DNA endonuclease domain-containing protein n=1 Tax=Aliivibrio fischeri TaxID=668 RepID=A0A510UFF4_ALIFS|nr:dsDNA nuclease domain-containing protein [Aliivibrio fischeri]GEK12041.1 hypothetical protein AFI02nite_00770 [Aliivibrio fischeri]
MTKMLHKAKPREQNGRDSYERYRLQVKSASIAALSILETTDVDRIYCDLHDDFVQRRKDSDGFFKYDFYQVKTKKKQNSNWTLLDVFGIKARGTENSQCHQKIKDSFIGKLLLHTMIFDDSCNEIVFQTNVNIDDNIECLLKDIKQMSFTNKYTQYLLNKFNLFFPEHEDLSLNIIKEKLSKIRFETDVQYLKSGKDNFEPIVRSKIYNFSEIDLSYIETKQIILKLLEIVDEKSSGVISEYNFENIEEESAISLKDLLSVLSISNDAFLALQKGGDPKAIKSASIIQRTLESSGGGRDEIEFCSRCKTEWDTWVRNNRHMISEMDLMTITEYIRDIIKESRDNNGGNIKISSLRKSIKTLLIKLKDEELIYDLNETYILGGIFSEVVKGKS